MGIETFRINEKTKNELKKEIVHKQEKYKTFRSFKNMFSIIVLCVPLLFLIYAYSISDGFVQLNDVYAPAGTKNHLFIWTCTITGFIILLFVYFVIRVVYNGLSSKTINERFGESLVLENRTLFYGYKLKMQSYTDERVVVNIPLDAVRYSIDKQNRKILFEGSIFSQFYTDYKNGVINGKGDYISDIVLYDYFEPSLISFLTNKDNIKGVTYYE